MKESIKYSELVNIVLLNEVYGGLGDHFRNEFVEGLKLTVDGLDTADVDKSIEGQRLKFQWDNWYVDNYSKIFNL